MGSASALLACVSESAWHVFHTAPYCDDVLDHFISHALMLGQSSRS